MRSLFILLVLCAVPVKGAESAFVLNLQYPTESNQTVHPIGPVNADAATEQLKKFPWLDLLKVANGPKGKTSPTLAVYNDKIDRIILISIVGTAEDHAFFVIYGKHSKDRDAKDSDSRIVTVKGLGLVERLLRDFFVDGRKDLEEAFAKNGQTTKEFFK